MKCCVRADEQGDQRGEEGLYRLLSLTLSFSLSLSLSLSHALSLTHTHFLSFSLSHTHTLSLFPSLSLSHTHYSRPTNIAERHIARLQMNKEISEAKKASADLEQIAKGPKAL